MTVEQARMHAQARLDEAKHKILSSAIRGAGMSEKDLLQVECQTTFGFHADRLASLFKVNTAILHWTDEQSAITVLCNTPDDETALYKEFGTAYRRWGKALEQEGKL